MTSRERVAAILDGKIPDRVAMDESPWSETYQRWRQEGLPENTSVIDYFGMDIAKVGGPDLTFRLETKVLGEDETYVTSINSDGVTARRHKTESGHTPHWLDHTIKTKDDWYAHAERLTPARDRWAEGIVEQCRAARDTGRYVTITHADPYERAWPTWGQVGIFEMMMDDPQTIGDCFMSYARLMTGQYQILEDLGAEWDAVFMYTDLGYRNSTLFSPVLYDELLFPAHKHITDWLSAHGRKLICHSCGRILTLIPRFIEVGFAAIQPLEAKCGQDVRELKQQYGGRITFFGNIDVRALSGSRQDVYNEVMGKLPKAMEGGGYIFHSDHSVPPTVSFENYSYAVELIREHGVY
jgi:uroporphyrinogen decarboxylase